MKKEYWNRDNLSFVNTEEFQYMDYIDKVKQINDKVKDILNKIDRNSYSDIINNREKIKCMNELKKIEKLLNEILEV